MYRTTIGSTDHDAYPGDKKQIKKIYTHNGNRHYAFQGHAIKNYGNSRPSQDMMHHIHHKQRNAVQQSYAAGDRMS